MACGLALGEYGNDDGNKGDGQRPSNSLQPGLIRLFPRLAKVETLEKFRNGQFADPEAVFEIRLSDVDICA